MTLAKRITLAVFAGLFAWAAFLQFNDADPALWIAIYGVASVVCAVTAAGVHLSRVVSLGGALAALAGSGWLAWLVFVAGEARPMFEQGAQTGFFAMEEGREMVGLIIVAAALGLTAWWAGQEQ